MHRFKRERSLISQRLDRGKGDMLPTHLKMLSQLLTGIAAPESISAQDRKAAGHKLAQLIRMGFLIIRCGNDRSRGHRPAAQ